MLANEIPVLSTILYYEMNGLLSILGFILFTTLLSIILVLNWYVVSISGFRSWFNERVRLNWDTH